MSGIFWQISVFFAFFVVFFAVFFVWFKIFFIFFCLIFNVLTCFGKIFTKKNLHIKKKAYICTSFKR